MDLSVIIVNYNVRYFLEQCLCSVQKAIESSGMRAETIVIDNNSSDNSLAYLAPRFPGVKFISNVSNKGFSKACNQGASIATGEFILFLNPDTIVPEDCFRKCLDFLHSHPDAGALGVRMIDGSGRFLKESKRAFPSPMTSLYKLAGLSALFPRSARFSKYHLGHLEENDSHRVDVLAGAFMMVRKDVFDRIGGFDEQFFMYGEDIDLSFRIQKEGHANYYFAGTTILHFKGESTSKNSLNYVRMFYNAMRVFVKKHYRSGRAAVFNFFLHLAIWLRAGYALVTRLVQWVGLPALDAAIIFTSFWLIELAWSNYIRPEITYPQRLLWIASVVFTLLYMIVAYYAGLYDKFYRRWNVFRSTLISTVVLLAIYSLIPERLRFSRGIILFGAMLAFVLMSLLRWLLIRQKLLQYDQQQNERPHILVAGSERDYIKLAELMPGSAANRVLGRVSRTEERGAIVSLQSLKSAALPYDEVIFCEGELSFREIISAMETLPLYARARLHASHSQSIVGSHSRNSSGESFSPEARYNLADPYRRRIKRLIDISFSLLFLLTFFIQVFLVRNAGRFFRNCLSVLTGSKTWVGYHVPRAGLPAIRPAVFASSGLIVDVLEDGDTTQKFDLLDQWYARDYEPFIDIKLLFRNYRR